MRAMGKGGRGDKYTYRTNFTLFTHLEVIEGKSKMKNFHKLLRNSLGERDREKAQLTEFSEMF